ncbi:hypothetical protein F2Q69_00014931 [Brassica cretica]|uniref:Strictosidine synthase conserved region domain-containing protein n=1 Tax=Brassica cretica TaxID=69181 RepID=A0A8S9QTX2_BRACR|nr:hypothetical protein F2Q69_00014931 [Brassica cretica]
MPINEKLPTWAVVPAVFAIFSVISYQILIAPDNLNGTIMYCRWLRPYHFLSMDQRALSGIRKEEVLMLLLWTAVFSSGVEMVSVGLSSHTHLLTEGGLAELVVDQAEGRKVMFANQMDIDEEEDVFYFNDSSDKYPFRDIFYVIVNGKRPGRVIRYKKKTKEAKVVMDNLRCNNGPKAGTRDIFAKVPGYPENIRLTPIGKLAEKAVKLELLIWLVNGFKPHGVAVKISGETGEIVEILEDKEEKTMQYVSEAYERDDGKIWFGSVFTPAVWVCK